MNPDIITQREAGHVLNLHPNSMSRLLSVGAGSAVVAWGGSDKQTTFSRALLLRWKKAHDCPRRARGLACPSCREVLEDSVLTARHLTQARHGALEMFEACPLDGAFCGHVGGWCRPCRPVEGLDGLNRLRTGGSVVKRSPAPVSAHSIRCPTTW